jgi:protein phosphatase PTC1
MEDAHSFVVDFDSIRGQGFFAVFDGHAGKHAAEWCGQHFHEVCCKLTNVPSAVDVRSKYLLDALHSTPDTPIPDIFNRTFHNVDASLSRMCEESDGKIHSGCTAVTAFLRIEDDDGHQSFINDFQHSPIANSTGSENDEAVASKNDSGDSLPINGEPKDGRELKSKSNRNRIRNALKSFGGGSSSSKVPSPTTPRSSSPTATRKVSSEGITITIPPSSSRRVLYCANAGDARGVLCRNGKAVRLTYDHKGSDRQEAKRITDAGGFVLSGRVNGVLAVTRSLGDSSMKEFVVGAPYTTETELCDEDEFLILACDGVCSFSYLCWLAAHVSTCF